VTHDWAARPKFVAVKTANNKQYPMAGEVGKENLLLLSKVIAKRQLVVSKRHWVFLRNVSVYFKQPTIQ